MKKVILTFGLVLAAVCLWKAFKGIEFSTVLVGIRNANWLWIAFAMAVYSFGYLFRAIRWSLLLHPVKRIQPLALFNPMMLGWFANNVLPLRMGEIVRAYLAGKKFSVSVSATLATILLERICDTLAFLSTFLISALFFAFPHYIEKGAAALGGACVLAIATLVFISHHLSKFNAIVHRIPLIPHGLKEKVIHIAANFSHGVSTMKSVKDILGSLALSIVIWVLEGTVLYMFGRAFSIGMSYPASFFLLFFLGISVTLPQAPGYVGVMELFGVSALGILGVPKDQALPVILTLHAAQFVYVGVLGLWALSREGLTLGSIVAIEHQAEEEI